MAEKTGDIKQIIAALKEAHTQTIFLAGMINDLSTLSRAERGKLELDIEPIDIGSCIGSLVNAYKTEAESKGLTLTLQLDPALDTLQSSRLYVQEVVQNFITNALKYTEKGGVTVKVSPTDDGISVAIKDTGIGISKSDREKIFDKFFRSEDYRTRATSGTGLGLYVTMKLLHLLHADVNVESKINQGSTFTVTFPNLH